MTAANAQYKVEHLAETPRGYKVRSVTRGSHVVRVAFPPGARKKGSGKVVEILHPKTEANPSCIVSHQAKNNPSELLIFGNPVEYKKVADGLSLHAAKKMVGQIHRSGKLAIYRKAGATYEVHQAEKNPSTQAAKRATRERAGRIRGARLNQSAFDAIRPGSRVTIVNRFGQHSTGRAVMRGPGGWVLNMGGRYGTPAIATPENVTKVRAGNPEKGDEKFVCKHCGQEFTAKQVEAGEYRKHIAGHRAKWSNPKRRRTDRTIRKNPSETEEAVRLFESFHGKDAKEIVEKHVSAAVRLDYAALGDLIALGIGEPKHHGNALVNHWQNENHLGFEGDGVKLASAPGGKQLYLIGGNQNLSKCLEKFDVDADKDFVDLGEIGFVVYLARKVHGNFEPIEYVHEFGEKSGALPTAFYDKLRKQIFFTGGEYFIKSEGVSPGIEN